MRHAPILGLLVLAASSICQGLVRAGDVGEQRAAIYRRAVVAFPFGLLLTPERPANDSTVFKLAPLLVRQVIRTNGSDRLHQDAFGRVRTNGSRLIFDPSVPTVYAWQSQARLNGRDIDQFSYVWFYREAAPESRPPASAENPETSHAPTAAKKLANDALPVQGVRVTLGTMGQPLAWEVLLDQTGAQLVVVSQSLEAAAVAEFGGPQPGRRFAVERSLTEAPRTVVARVIEEGPLELGPIVYLESGTRNVSTIICRCMPAQVRSVPATGSYELVNLTRQSALLELIRRNQPADPAPTWWPGETNSLSQLSGMLRWPRKL